MSNSFFLTLLNTIQYTIQYNTIAFDTALYPQFRIAHTTHMTEHRWAEQMQIKDLPKVLTHWGPDWRLEPRTFHNVGAPTTQLSCLTLIMVIVHWLWSMVSCRAPKDCDLAFTRVDKLALKVHYQSKIKKFKITKSKLHFSSPATEFLVRLHCATSLCCLS